MNPTLLYYTNITYHFEDTLTDRWGLWILKPWVDIVDASPFMARHPGGLAAPGKETSALTPHTIYHRTEMLPRKIEPHAASLAKGGPSLLVFDFFDALVSY